MSLFSPLRPLTVIALFLWLLVSILLIAATGATLFVTAGTGGGSEVQLGAFSICSTGQSCSSVSTSCGFSFQDQSQTLPGSCSTFQAFRAFLIIGLLLALGITIACYAVFFLHKTADSVLNWTILMLSMLESLCILIAFSCIAGWYNSLGSGFSYGASFGLLVSSWVFGLFAAGLWFTGCAWEAEGGGSAASGWGGVKQASGQHTPNSNSNGGSAEMQQQQLGYNAQPEQPSTAAAYTLPVQTYAAQHQDGSWAPAATPAPTAPQDTTSL